MRFAFLLNTQKYWEYHDWLEDDLFFSISLNIFIERYRKELYNIPCTETERAIYQCNQDALLNHDKYI